MPNLTFRGELSMTVQGVQEIGLIDLSHQETIRFTEVLVSRVISVWEEAEDSEAGPVDDDFVYDHVRPWFMAAHGRFFDDIQLSTTMRTYAIIPPPAVPGIRAALDQLHRQVANCSRQWVKPYAPALKREFQTLTQAYVDGLGTLAKLQARQLLLVRKHDAKRQVAFAKYQAAEVELSLPVLAAVAAAMRWGWFVLEVQRGEIEGSAGAQPGEIPRPQPADFASPAATQAFEAKWVAANRAMAKARARLEAE